MTTTHTREAFIPHSREDLIARCIADGRLAAAQVQPFRAFCELLMAYYHFQFHHELETLKRTYAPLNPDATPHADRAPAPSAAQADEMVSTLEQVLRRANYTRLADATLQQALSEISLIDLRTHINFDDFVQVLVYHRGQFTRTATVKHLLFLKKDIVLDVFDRVVMLFTFKDAAHFEAQDRPIDKLDFTPGQTYLYLYKNIPKNDLELLFPNVQIGMNNLDRFMFLAPAIAAGIAMLLKILPNMLLIAGVLLFFILGPQFAQQLGFSEQEVRDIMPVLTAFVTLSAALGGFAMKQYSGYKNKRLQFMKHVTDTLFFRNLSNNASVLHTLIDAAEEEETKEIILVTYHLLTSDRPLTATELDEHIETWMHTHLGTVIDFDIDQTLQQLEALRTDDVPLLQRDAKGHCHLLPLEQAKIVLDQLWDDAFQYA